jgi:hypothetical protein
MRLYLASLLALIMFVVPGQAQEESRFDVRYAGLRVGEITLVAEEIDAAYAIAGRFDSTGLATLFREVRFDMTAEGRFNSPIPRPRRYAADINTGRRESRVTLTYQGDTPAIAFIGPPRAPAPWDTDPAAQSGTVDPLSALYRLARPQPATTLCNWTLPIFDGRRRARLVLGPGRGNTGTITCDGLYQRVAGYTPEEMADRRAFPFTASFSETTPGVFRLTSVAAQSLYGPVRIIRRP